MAREISRDELNDIVNEMNLKVEELNECLGDLKKIEEGLPEVWRDTDSSSKVNDCLNNIADVGATIERTVNLSAGASELLAQDASTGGDN